MTQPYFKTSGLGPVICWEVYIERYIDICENKRLDLDSKKEWSKEFL